MAAPTVQQAYNALLPELISEQEKAQTLKGEIDDENAGLETTEQYDVEAIAGRIAGYLERLNAMTVDGDKNPSPVRKFTEFVARMNSGDFHTNHAHQYTKFTDELGQYNTQIYQLRNHTLLRTQNIHQDLQANLDPTNTFLWLGRKADRWFNYFPQVGSFTGAARALRLVGAPQVDGGGTL